MEKSKLKHDSKHTKYFVKWHISKFGFWSHLPQLRPLSMYKLTETCFSIITITDAFHITSIWRRNKTRFSNASSYKNWCVCSFFKRRQDFLRNSISYLYILVIELPSLEVSVDLSVPSNYLLICERTRNFVKIRLLVQDQVYLFKSVLLHSSSLIWKTTFNLDLMRLQVPASSNLKLCQLILPKRTYHLPPSSSVPSLLNCGFTF